MGFHTRIVRAFTVAGLAIAINALPAGVQSQRQLTQNALSAEQVDINTASLDQLIRIPGLTRTWAARIIRYRPYRGKNELLDRGVLTGEVYARIKDRIIAHRQAR